MMDDEELSQPEGELGELFESPEFREAVEEAMQSLTEKFPQLKGFLLLGWTAVFEYIDPQARRWIIREWGKDTPGWLRDGYLFQSLFGGFNE